MAKTTQKETGREAGHVARASSRSLSISTKHSVEISSHLRYKRLGDAKKILEDAIALRRAIPFKRFKRDIGHKRGMASGRYIPKAARAFLGLLKSVEANAQDLGLDAANLKITKILANKASIPGAGGRTRGSPKRTHVEIEVREAKAKPAKTKKKAKATKAKAAPVKKETRAEAPAEKREEAKKEEVKVAKDAKKKSEGASQ